MFYIINIILGIIFIFLDLNNYDSSLIKYFTIFNNLLYIIIKNTNKHALLALIFTFIADYFLLFTNIQTIGVFCFILVQINYMRLLDYNTFSPFIGFILLPINLLFTLAIVYGLLSLSNLYHSYLYRHQNKQSYFFFLAILLLLCCDFFVAITNINITTPAFFSNLIWIFYLPSQLFFVASQIILEK